MDTSRLDLDASFYFDLDLAAQLDDPVFHVEKARNPTAYDEPLANSTVGPIRVSLACNPCRSRHVKCDASKPTCTRCRLDDRPCGYAKSRRGGQTRAARLRQRAGINSQPSNRINDTADYLSLPLSNFPASSTLSDGTGSGGSPNDSTGGVGHSSFQYNADKDTSRLLDLYFTYFHDAHPFILPQEHLISRMQSNHTPLRHLVLVLEYIGSLYAPDIPSDPLRDRIQIAFPTCDLPSDGFSVQALLLFAIATHCNDEFDLARQLLDQAIFKALIIRMHCHRFSTECGENSSILEESWRRTWWGLYVTDGTFSGIRRQSTFRLWAIDADVDLPCEESAYRRGEVPQPRTLRDYDEREFATEDLEFSSFTYLIDAGRIAGAVLAVATDLNNPLDPLLATADTRLANWALHLPKAKQEVIGDRGIDEPLFQAHMLINTLRIYLHRPRSRLVYNDIEDMSECTPNPSSDEMIAARQKVYAFHTTRALEGIEGSLALLTLPSPVLKHTPMIMCGLSLAIMGQLSACTKVLDGADCSVARDRIRLGIGAIKAYVDVWKVGQKTIREVKIIARELLSANAKECKSTSSRDPIEEFAESLSDSDLLEPIGHRHSYEVPYSALRPLDYVLA